MVVEKKSNNSFKYNRIYDLQMVQKMSNNSYITMWLLIVIGLEFLTDLNVQLQYLQKDMDDTIIMDNDNKKTRTKTVILWGRLDPTFSASTFWSLRFLCFFVCFFFFLLPAYVDFGGQKLLFCTVATLFMYCSDTVHALKNIKNGSHGTFHTFKNYFATVFSVFSFQFQQQ